MAMDNPNDVEGRVIPYRQVEKEWRQANYPEFCGSGQCLCIVAPKDGLKMYRSFKFDYKPRGDSYKKWINGSDDELQYAGMPFQDTMQARFGPQASGNVLVALAPKDFEVNASKQTTTIIIRPDKEGQLVTPRIKIWDVQGRNFSITMAVTWRDYSAEEFKAAFGA